MNIRRTAWHFRIYRFLISMWSEGPDIFDGRRTAHEPRDLCHYFWALVVLAISFPIWVVIALVALIAFGIIFVAVNVWELIIAPPFRRLGQKINEAEARKPPKAPKAPKAREPGLVRTYVKARKQKLCPVITIVDE